MTALKGFIGGSIRNPNAYYTSAAGVSCDGAGTLTVNYLDGVIFVPITDVLTEAVRWHGAKSFTFADFGLGTGSVYRVSILTAAATVRWFGIKDAATAGKYTIGIYDNAASPPGEILAGTTEYDYGTAYTYLAETDGSTLRVFFGDLVTAELSLSTADNLYEGAVGVGMRVGAALVSSSGTFTCVFPFMSSGGAGDQQPDPTTGGYIEQTPTGDSSNDNEFTIDEAGAGATTKYDSVDEWATTTHDSDTTYNTHTATPSTTFRQAYTTPDNTLTKDVYCGLIAFVGRGDIAAKNLLVTGFGRDASVRDEGTEFNAGESTYAYRRDTFPLAPDGGVWTQAKIDAWEIGVRATVGAAPVTYRISAIQGEIAGFDLQAAAAATDRRRLLAQMV